MLVITGGVGIFLAAQMVPTFRHYGIQFLTTARWQPEFDLLGIAGVLVGTVTIALLAMSVAFPLALLTALFITEYAPNRIKGFLVSLVDLMAAVPSIVYGLWGFFLMMPHVAEPGVLAAAQLRLDPVLRGQRHRPGQPRLAAVAVRRELALRRRTGRHDGAADGLRDHAAGLLADPAG
ncbi:hypothetical protein [Nocardioides convexus]|uniref:PstC family ABC transporter permease n=1 Tax=Nocardioides convexus TaxID=2712224 RepID=UPI002418B622|nr:hypothetical protein [Nocardioides convexus]